MSAAGAGLHIRRASLADVGPLSAFARRAFHDTFAPDNDPADMAAYLADAFSPAKQGAELAHPQRTCLLAELDGALVGYAAILDAAGHPSVPARHPVELERFYVDQAWHGRGIAGALMTAVIDAATHGGGDALWLGVWERNTRAIRFYRTRGFERVGAQTFRLGADLQQDDVMRRAL